MTLRKAILSVVIIAAFIASHFIQGSLNHDRETFGLTRTAIISNAPPILAFTTVALGGFRGLIANTLWIRTTELQEDGKYFEAVQLADWITKLQPHFTSVWVHQAWNMAYNISVKFPNPEDRWLWVQRAIELLRMVGIPKPERRIDEYSFQLSGGLRQRVMIAMALSSEPRVLIADEPTTALDVTTQAQILDLLRQLQAERGLSIILLTHDMGVIAEMADDVVVMYLGRVVEQGPVDEIFHAPKHPYTRLLLKSIPSILAQPRTKLATLTGSIPHPYNRPVGCPFHPRCPDFMAGRCNVHEPQPRAVNERQVVSCFLYEA